MTKRRQDGCTWSSIFFGTVTIIPLRVVYWQCHRVVVGSVDHDLMEITLSPAVSYPLRDSLYVALCIVTVFIQKSWQRVNEASGGIVLHAPSDAIKVCTGVGGER